MLYLNMFLVVPVSRIFVHVGLSIQTIQRHGMAWHGMLGTSKTMVCLVIAWLLVCHLGCHLGCHLDLPRPRRTSIEMSFLGNLLKVFSRPDKGDSNATLLLMPRYVCEHRSHVPRARGPGEAQEEILLSSRWIQTWYHGLKRHFNTHELTAKKPRKNIFSFFFSVSFFLSFLW